MTGTQTEKKVKPIAKNVLDFWFGERPLTPEQHAEQGARWFASDQDFDYDIERRFGKLVSAARKGAFDFWATEPENGLALIIILDQFPRNLFRGQAGAFASDEKALELARGLVKSGNLANLNYPERAFALMPYQHSEDLAVQQESVQIYQAQADSAPEEWQKALQGYADFAQQHLNVIEQFGRFPHRNAALGRDNMAEEDVYLNGGGSRFGQ